jgi:NADH:ubiquinone oxidoreductase subunit 6 (subunit J)
MTDSTLTGAAVVEQSEDNSLGNTEPVVSAGAVVGFISAVASVLVIGGWIGEDQKRQLESSAGVIVPALLLIVPIVASIIGRMKAYSPRSAARIAVNNAAAPAGTAPTISSPP